MKPQLCPCSCLLSTYCEHYSRQRLFAVVYLLKCSFLPSLASDAMLYEVTSKYRVGYGKCSPLQGSRRFGEPRRFHLQWQSKESAWQAGKGLPP
jgi:hypothetical protein